MVRTEWYALQPHHTAEIPLELFTSCIMSARPEETITEKDILVVLHEIAGSVDGVHDLLNFLYVDVALLPCKDVIAREQLVGNVIERCIMMRHGIDLLVETRPALHIVQHLVHVATEPYHHRQQLVFLHLAQHAIDIQMIQLQIQVGGYETWEVAVVVLLVHMEQLRVV